MYFTRCMVDQGYPNGSILTTMAKDPIERLHLGCLKWMMGVNKTTSNAAVWGDSGRFPLAIELSKQVFSYADRLKQMDQANSNALVRHAYCEQRALGLLWYKRLNKLRELSYSSPQQRVNFPSRSRMDLRKMFVQTWDTERKENRKLTFYNSIKSSFGAELYTKLNLKADETKRMAQFRTSSHKYNVETGRYGLKRKSIVNRICPHCTSSPETMEDLSELPFFEAIIEDEMHVLRDCHLYNGARSRISSSSQHIITSGSLEEIEDLFEDTVAIRDLARFLSCCHALRFPKTEKNKDSPTQ